MRFRPWGVSGLGASGLYSKNLVPNSTSTALDFQGQRSSREQLIRRPLKT